MRCKYICLYLTPLLLWGCDPSGPTFESIDSQNKIIQCALNGSPLKIDITKGSLDANLFLGDRDLNGYMPGVSYVYHDASSKKFFFKDFEGRIMTINNGGTLAELDKFIKKNNIELQDSGYMADGGMMAKDEESILVYYVNHYPEDELGLEIKAKATFKGLNEVLDNKKDVYSYIGVGDSLVRERVFIRLAQINRVDYDVIYKKWLESDEYAKGGYMAKGGKTPIVRTQFEEEEFEYANGGEVAKYNVSFNYNPSNLSNEDAEKIAEKYTKDWKHNNDFDEVSFYVLSLSKENSDMLVKELKMEDVYNIEVDKSRYANGGKVEKAFEVILQNPNGKMNKRGVLLAKTKDDASKKALNLKEFKQYGYVVISANEIKYADGGKTTIVEEFGSMSFRNQYDDYEMVVIAKELEKDGGYTHTFRYLVSAKDIQEAKEIATGLWEQGMSNSDLHIVKVMSDEAYRLNYMGKYDGGGELKEDFLEDLHEMHQDIDTISLQDGTTISGKELHEAHKMAHGGEVKAGDVLEATTGVKVKVIEYDPKFGGRVRVERMDEYATGKPSHWMFLTKFKMPKEEKKIEEPKKAPRNKEALKKKLNEFKKGGEIKKKATFNDKVDAISKSLEGKKVKSKYKGKYGATYDRKEAKEAAKNIVGKIRAKYGK